MSIVLRANQLNTIIYKYLLEAGLSHSAYTLFNEATLTLPLQEFRFDIRSGHLLSLLEKALTYIQIEAHVSMTEYFQCSEPFHLLKSHTCNIVEKVKKEKQELMKELEDQIADSIKRTNSIYNAAVVNKDYDEIVYESKGSKYFDKFVKIKYPLMENEQPPRFILQGTDQNPLLYNTSDYQIDLLKYDSLNEEITMTHIYPCVKNGELEHPLAFQKAGDYLIEVYNQNHITLFKTGEDTIQPIQFTLEGNSQITRLSPNPNLPQLLAFIGQKQFWIINLSNLKLIIYEKGLFCWKTFDEYLTISDKGIEIHSICSNNLTMKYPSNMEWQEVQFNYTKTLFATISYTNKRIHVYTFSNEQPLFIFDLEQEKVLREVLWATSNNVDYICWLTDTQIKIFDISLNSYAKIIDIQEYDSTVTRICLLKKSQKDECYLIGLGSQNLLVYDITNVKMQRIEVQSKVRDLRSLSLERLAMITDGCIYFLVGQYIEPIFK